MEIPRMPCRYGSSPQHRIRVELIEADLEIGFTLTDLAASRSPDSSRLLAEAGHVLLDALARVNRLEPAEQKIFEPLIKELRRAIDLAGLQSGG